MDNHSILGSEDPSRRAFLSASAVTAVAAPVVSRTTQTATAPALPRRNPANDLRALLHQVDPGRIQATVLRLTQFGTRHTLSSQTDPVRGIGAATAWVVEQMQARHSPEWFRAGSHRGGFRG